MAGLRIIIKGAAYCDWSETWLNRSTNYKGEDQYFNEIIYLFGSKNGEPKKVEAGVYTYAFLCFLTAGLPSSVDAKNGSISYSVQAILDIPWRMNVFAFKSFTICENLDLNLYPDLKMPCEEEYVANSCFLLPSQPVLLEASIPYSGYSCGDTINVAIKVINNSNKPVPRVKIELLRRIKYTFLG